MQIGPPGSMSLIEGGTSSISRSKIAEDSKADPKSESQGVLPEAHSASHRPHWQSRIHQ